MRLFRKSEPDRSPALMPGFKRQNSSERDPAARVAEFPAPTAREGGDDLYHALRQLQILLHNKRLYHHSHPKSLESLNVAFQSLERVARAMNGLELRVEPSGIVVPKVGEARLSDHRGEFRSLASDFQQAGVQTLVLRRQFHVGELDTFAQLLRASLLKSDELRKTSRGSWWEAKFLEFGVEGIQVNSQTDRRVDTVLASLVAALVAFGGNTPNQDADAPIVAPTLESLSAVLRLIARLTPPLESARGLSPEEAARAIHGALAEANRDTVHLLLSAISQHAPREAEAPQPYLVRLSEQMVLEFLNAEFSGGGLAPKEVSRSMRTLGEVLVS